MFAKGYRRVIFWVTMSSTAHSTLLKSV